MFYVYILKCADDTLYCGYTNDLQKRLLCHQSGKGAKYTRGRLPVELVYFEQIDDKGDALRREHEIKKMPRAKKEELVRRFDKSGV